MFNLRDLKVKSKMLLLVGIFMVGFLGYALFSYSTLNTLKINGTIYQDIKSEQDLMNDIAAPDVYLIEACYNSMRLVDEEKPEKIQEFIQRVKAAQGRYEERYEYWKKNLPEGKIKEAVTVKSHEKVMVFLNLLNNELIPAVLSGDRQKANEISGGPMRKAFVEHRNFIDEAEKLTKEDLLSHEVNASSIVSWRTTFLIAIAVGIILLVLVFTYFIIRSITGPLGQVVEKLKLMAIGDVNQSLDYQSKDEIGSLADAFRSMIDYLKEAALTIDAMSKGDLSRKIVARSEQDAVSNNLKQAVQALQGLTLETHTMIGAVQNGRLHERGNTSKFQGAYAEIVDGLNQVMEAVATPLNEASECLQRVAERDLTAYMTGDYKGDFATIKDALNMALTNLDEGMQQIAVGAEQVTSAATEISSGSQSLAQGASEQASTLEEIASNLQEISSMTRQNAANSKEARSMSDSARTSTEGGIRNMKRLSEAVEKIKESSDSTSKIVKTIEEIAFQTNLLALNAAVEAARAGDAGKGFAVVAEEVRNLAKRSAEAAQTTAQLIDEAVKNTESGVTLNTEVSQNLEEISAQIEKVSVVMAEIAAASEQQNQGVEQINEAVEQMNGVTQQTAANSEESASAAEELSGQSQEMLGLIGGYKLSNETKSRRQPVSMGTFSQKPATVGAGTVRTSYAKKNGRKKSTGSGGFGSMPGGDNLIPFGDMDDATLREF